MAVRLPTPYQELIYKSRYSRYIEADSRREDLDETVNRYLNFMSEHLEEKHGYTIPLQTRARLFGHICDLKNMPSMRALMTAGAALARDNTAGFNCSFLPVEDARAFDETMFILLCGTGVGFSVENRFIRKLPRVPDLRLVDEWIDVEDSKEGWAFAYQELVRSLFQGKIPKYNTSAVRPAGARLKTFGGRASGPKPLIELFEFTIKTFRQAQGRHLRSLECHDIQCKVGDIVVVGGVRRSAMISLSDLDDVAMANAKGFFEVIDWDQIDWDGYVYNITLVNAYGETEDHTITFKKDAHEWDIQQMKEKGTIGWWHPYPYRMLSNNSAVYETKPGRERFDKEWQAMIASQSGERGIFSREAATNQVKKNGRRSAVEENGEQYPYGCNPCSEILLRPYQMCNLSTNIVRADDTLDDLLAKVEVATTLGTYQSTLTYFPYLRDIWRKNTEEERLLGVSLTGVMDHPILNGSLGEDARDAWLILLTEHAVAVNRRLATDIGIEQSVAITCVKPEGTCSQLTDSASGIHTRHSPFYLRSIRQDNKDPVTAFLIAQGVPHEPCLAKPQTTTIFYFPIKAPEGALTRHDVTAVEQLESWLAYQRYYCEHKPSCTISVGEDEWAEVGDWVFKHFDEISGVSFLPRSEHIYQQAPYQDLTEAEYLDWLAKSPTGLDWTKLSDFEKEDATTSTQTLACTAGGCEI
jgi:ribonucleoside-triphosphate reductase (thioredoxin)